MYGAKLGGIANNDNASHIGVMVLYKAAPIQTK